MEEMDKPSDGRFWTIGGEWAKKYVIISTCVGGVAFITMLCRYRDRYWRESTFRGVELVRKTLEDVYGADKVSLVSAALRWLNHHSAMKPECNGEIICG